MAKVLEEADPEIICVSQGSTVQEVAGMQTGRMAAAQELNMRDMLKSKIHRATVTEANLDYVGSVTIDKDLLQAADIYENEFVDIWDLTNGNRISTYTLCGPSGSGVICINGAAAHRIHEGDLVIVASHVQLDDEAAKSHTPRLVFVDKHNRIVETDAEGAVAEKPFATAVSKH